MTMLTRYNACCVMDYLDQLKQKDYSKPSDDTLKSLSILINESTAKSFTEMNLFLQSCPTMMKGVKALREAPRLRGPAKTSQSLLAGFTPYEQISALKRWIDTSNFSSDKRTLSLYQEEGSIPVAISPPRKSKLDLYPVFIGNARGALKGPSYTDWQEEDPLGTAREIFIYSLDALEMHRTGKGDGALLLKKGAYECDLIDHTWRYAVYDSDGSDAPEASVELPQQKSSKAARARAFAPGYNLAEMIRHPQLRNKSIIPERNYEDFCDDVYDDDAIATATPLEIVQSFNTAIQGNHTKLDSLIAKLSATHLSQSAIPAVKTFTAQRLGFTE